MPFGSDCEMPIGLMRVPEGPPDPEIVFEAVDGAKNRGFTRASLEVKP